MVEKPTSLCADAGAATEVLEARISACRAWSRRSRSPSCSSGWRWRTASSPSTCARWPRPCRPAEYEAEALARALAYPWDRPDGSYRQAGGGVEPLERMAAAERDAAIAEYASDEGRLPLLAIGSNGSPGVLERKFAHFPAAADRAVLVLTGRLHDFDVGFAAQPALYGSMPATIFPSPGTEVRAAVLWVTAAQFTQLAWSELSYRLGRLRTRFAVDEGGAAFDELLVFAPASAPSWSTASLPRWRRSPPAAGAPGRLPRADHGRRRALAIGPRRGPRRWSGRTSTTSGRSSRNWPRPSTGSSQPFASERWSPFSPRA